MSIDVVIVEEANEVVIEIPSGDSVEISSTGGGSGVSDHSQLSNLSFAGSGHTGFQPAGSYLTLETDPVFSLSAAFGIDSGDITAWDAKPDLGDINVWTGLNTFNGNIGLAEDDYVGYPSVIGASYMPTEGVGYNSVLNTLNTLFVNLDSGNSGFLRAFTIAKGRTGISGGTPLFQFSTDGNVALYLENSFFGYPGSTAQGFCPFTSSYNFLFNSLFNHYFIVDTGNTSALQKFVWAHDGVNESATEIASLTEAGNFTTTGAFKPGSLADSAAQNNSIYYSTDAGRLVYKDGGGVVNNLY